MRASAVLAVAALLVMPLTWLALRSVDADAERFDRILAEMARFATSDALYHRDLISARAGLLRNYDFISRDVEALESSLELLDGMIGSDPEPRAAYAALADSVEWQGDMLEHFKTNNALLQNSLAYFSLYSSRHLADASARLAPSIAALSIAMMRLTLDTSTDNVEAVEHSLQLLDKQAKTPSERDSIHFLMTHGALLGALLPATDEVLRQIEDMRERADWERLHRAILERQSTSREKALHFRWLLYVASLVLAVLLAYFAMELHARVLALRRRAAFGHALAGFSLTLINAPEGDLNGLICRTLEKLARCIEAERAYLLPGLPNASSFTWCRPQTGFTDGWPAGAIPLLDGFDGQGEGATRLVPVVNRLPDGPARVALASAGLQGWLCASRRGTGADRWLLGFDFVTRPCRVVPAGDIDLMQMALDVMLGAVERRTLSQERVRLTARLDQARRLETVGTLASGVAHNFNNILGAILGYAEMAREEGAGGNRADRIFADIQRAGERGRELVDEILAFGRHRDRPRSRIDLRELVEEAVSLLRASLPAEVDLAVAFEERPMIVSGVWAQLQQVILNLCNNAAQAMEFAGRIGMEIVAVDLADTRIFKHGALPPGSYVRLSVTDSGRGIEAEHLQRIFEPFFSTKDKGTGLGLATNREIAREHGGVVHLSSTSAAGTCFEMWLPLLPVAALTSENATSVRGNGEVILLLAPDAQQRLRDEEMLAALGYEPVGFASVDAACDACRDGPDRFDMALIDHVGPGAALLEHAALLHIALPVLPILAVTASGDTLDADALLAAGISDVLPHPPDAAEIAVALTGCLERKREGMAA